MVRSRVAAAASESISADADRCLYSTADEAARSGLKSRDSRREMQLNNCHAFCLILSSPWAFELGSVSTKVAVVVLFGLTVFVTAITPGTTFLTRLPKWFLVLVSTGLLISQAIFTFGSPLAGVIYWLSCSLAAAVLLPVALILLVTVSFRSQPPRFVVPQIGVCVLLGLMCLATQ